MKPQFDWDERKASKNEKKHGVSFDDAATSFEDHRGLDLYDKRHSVGEDRQILIALSTSGELLVTVYTEDEEEEELIVRIISSRRATQAEENKYFKRGRH